MESNYFTEPRYCFKFYVPNSINELMKRGIKELIFLFLPEDTTENGDYRHSDGINIGVNKTRDKAKVLFWITISVAVTLAIGQLK